jgi:hypothetical protein
MGLYQIKDFCTAKEMILKVKRKLTEQKNIFASYSSGSRLISRIYSKPMSSFVFLVAILLIARLQN